MTRHYRNPRESEIVALDGLEVDEDDNPLSVAYYAGGSNDNTSDAPEIASYGEVYLGEITDEEHDGICWGYGNGDGRGETPYIDVFDDPEYEENFICGDGDSRVGARKSGDGFYCGDGDGWGDVNGGGRTRSLYSIGIYD